MAAGFSLRLGQEGIAGRLPPIRLELRKGAAVVTVEWPASLAAACGVWLREWLE